MAGVTVNGFVPKRLNEIIRSLEDNAKPIFQDLVKPGEEVDVSANSTIGRMIGLVSLDLDELWQGLQQVYQAFDPNSAEGVALENIVQYMAVQRRQGRPTVVRSSVWGDIGVSLPQGQVVRSVTGQDFLSTMGITFTNSDILGGAILPTNLTEGEVVSFTTIVDEGIYTISHTNGPSETEATISESFKTEFDALGLTRFTTEVRNGRFYVWVNEYFSYITLPTVVGCSIVEVKKRLPFESSVEGDFEVPIGTFTNIVTPVFGWTSVTNDFSAEAGSVYESDEELRDRFRVSKAVRASNLAESLYSQLLELESVTFVRVYENMTDAVDLLGLPPHSFMAVVRGGANNDIGKIVWNNKPLGIGSHGNTSVVVRDSQNREREVKFSRASDVLVYVDVVVEKTDNTLPDDAADQIREAILDYINEQTSFGESVYYTRLFTPVNTVSGHQITSLTLGRDPLMMSQSNLVINWDEYPFALPESISVTVNT
jgi:uncharacterized phage protein gp47/JayE